MDLSGQQRKKLQEAFIDAFPDKLSLEQMLLFGLDKYLDAIAGGGSLENIVFSLIKTAVAQGWLVDLVRAARKDNPGNSKLGAIAPPQKWNRLLIELQETRSWIEKYRNTKRIRLAGNRRVTPCLAIGFVSSAVRGY